MVGFFALIGIAVNNTILLTDYANQLRRAGDGRIDAMAGAVKASFSPLITTSLTSVEALLPLALTDPFWESLSYTLIFGLLSSTFLVVITFPYVYLAGEILRIIGHKAWFRELPKPVQYPLNVLLLPFWLVGFVLSSVFRTRT
jgi:multidrug efflux pump subunit AcrB